MTNVLFNRESLRVTGVGRDPLPFEVEIKNINEEELRKLTKIIEYIEMIQKKDEDGYPLYFLPQDPIEIEVTKEVRVKKTEVSDEPVMLKVIEKVPVLDEDGNQVTYEVTQTITTPAVYDEEGNLIEEGKTEVVGTGVFLPCFTTEEREHQETDEEGNPLYWHTEEQTVTEIQEQPSLEITSFDSRFTDTLKPVLIPVTKQKTVNFNENMNEFTFDDICKFKESLLIKETFFTKAILYENPEQVIDSNSAADMGFGMISIPPEKEIITMAIQLPNATDLIGVYFEASDNGLDVEVGKSTSEFKLINQRNEVHFDEMVSEVYIRFKNTTDKRIDLYSFGLLV